MSRIIIVWGLWGPYHRHRFQQFRKHAAAKGHVVMGVSLFSGSRDYQWSGINLPEGVFHFDLGKDETQFPFFETGRLLMIPDKMKANVVFLPSYFHWSLALNAAARLFGARVVMMNDTHAGTARAKGVKARFKHWIVSHFHAGFVAGHPHKRYFSECGLPSTKIYTGYDAVDNNYFSTKAAKIRGQESEVRSQYDLPPRYFLSLGRFVPKKNLSTLIRAYALLLKSEIGNRKPQIPPHLVMVGSGEEEPKLRALCQELGLPIFDKSNFKIGNRKSEIVNSAPGVHFYGFRQIEENPVFYALAEAFILPSLYEEWGLVVNEAMACGLPVVVSEPAGCAEDLLPKGYPVGTDEALAAFPQLLEQVRQTGFVFNPQSPESLTESLLALAASPLIRGSMGQNSRKVVEQFSCENFARNALLAAQAALAT